MFRFVMMAAAILACVSAQAAQYPAGVNPQSCPNFPLCDNAALHGQATPGGYNAAPQAWNAPAQPSWNAAPAQQHWNAPAQNQWNAPAQNQWNAPAAPQPSWNAAPAQQHWNAPAAPQNNWNAQPQPQWNSPAAPAHAGAHGAPAAQYPAGVDPSSCPGYPYCNGIGSNPSQASPLPGFTSRLYPEGVSSQSCPNYPYCN